MKKIAHMLNASSSNVVPLSRKKAKPVNYKEKSINC
jgi:hypothetical protein